MYVLILVNTKATTIRSGMFENDDAAEKELFADIPVKELLELVETKDATADAVKDTSATVIPLESGRTLTSYPAGTLLMDSGVESSSSNSTRPNAMHSGRKLWLTESVSVAGWITNSTVVTARLLGTLMIVKTSVAQLTDEITSLTHKNSIQREFNKRLKYQVALLETQLSNVTAIENRVEALCDTVNNLNNTFNHQQRKVKVERGSITPEDAMANCLESLAKFDRSTLKNKQQRDALLKRRRR